MPIHTDFKSMLQNMRNQYCRGYKGKMITEKFSDGSSIRLCPKARSIFYATIRKNRWDETKPRPKATSETVEWLLRQRGIKIPEWMKTE